MSARLLHATSTAMPQTGANRPGPSLGVLRRHSGPSEMGVSHTTGLLSTMRAAGPPLGDGAYSAQVGTGLMAIRLETRTFAGPDLG